MKIKGEIKMNMIFRGYAMDERGYHGGGIFLPDEAACANFIYLGTQSPNIRSVMITDIFDCRVAETLPGTPFLDYLHPDYHRILEILIPLQQGISSPTPLDFTFLEMEDQEIMKEYGEVYEVRFGFDSVSKGQFSEPSVD